MRLLGFCLLLVLISIVSASGLLSKTINADGSKEFRIAKQIKHNTCLCQCRCVPETTDLFARRPVKTPASPENVEVDDNDVKEEKRLKESMVQELTEFTTQSANTATKSIKTSYNLRPSTTLASPKISKTTFGDVPNIYLPTETISSSGITLLSENSTSQAHIHTIKMTTSPNRATYTSEMSVTSPSFKFQFHGNTSHAVNIVPFTRTLNSAILTSSSLIETMDSTDEEQSIARDDIKLRNIPSLFGSSTTHVLEKTVNKEKPLDFPKTTRRNIEFTTKTKSREKLRTFKTTTPSTNNESLATVTNSGISYTAAIISDDLLRKEKQIVASQLVQTTMASLENDTSLKLILRKTTLTNEVLASPIENHSVNSSLQKAYGDFVNKVEAYSTAAMESTIESITKRNKLTTPLNTHLAHEADTQSSLRLTTKSATQGSATSEGDINAKFVLITPTPLHTTTKTITAESTAPWNSKLDTKTTHERTTTLMTPLMTQLNSKAMTESNPLVTIQSTSYSTQESTIHSTIQTTTESSREMMSHITNPLNTKASTALAIASVHTQTVDSAIESFSVKTSMESTEDSAQFKATSETVTLSTTTTSSRGMVVFLLAFILRIDKV
ncbi:hypothetical protein KIN20_025189 [Parelaphostrongylus tenuis]|uniref:Uncharacterized protein n=1 Tax=Parelaphostrongylus tenuis TaxID=148309 RepID=A0AAD5N910_PARTN|nr:hypothetical protein KIN20_025189 [Parelaphostrongylus tenuis]